MYVTWKDPQSRKRYIVGTLGRGEGEYKFSYTNYLLEAERMGFKKFREFPEENKIYSSKYLFFTFKSRIPNRNRSDFKYFLNERGLEESADDLKILSETRGFLSTDTIELLNVLPNTKKSNFIFEVYLAGVRHYLELKNDKLVVKTTDKEIILNTKIKLVLEPENKYDQYAIAVKTSEEKVIGYIPNCYARELSDLLKKINVEVKIMKIFSKKGEVPEIKINIYNI